MKKITRAILSVSDKTGLVELGRALHSRGVELYSTGGTLKTLVEAGIPALSIESYTGFPEMLDGRVKTLHPKIHGGILARRDLPDHLEALKAHNILPFDLVVINLYPFEDVIRREQFSFEEAVENIDIGGPSMIRAAAKNYRDVVVIVDPQQYDRLLKELEENEGATSEQFRFTLMTEAFAKTGAYDSVISQYLNSLQEELFADSFNLSLKRHQPLRYGENPHQSAAFYALTQNPEMPWRQLHGKELSFNNIIDLDIALKVGAEYKQNICAIFKHTNPCGIAAGRKQEENLRLAMAADPISFFGGIVLFNETLAAPAAQILAEHFFEIIVAEHFSPEAQAILEKKKNIRLIAVPQMTRLRLGNKEIRSAAGGFLVQTIDAAFTEKEQLKIVSAQKPDDALIEEMLFAFQAVKYVKSNAVIFTKDKVTLGIGAGQMSRVDSIKFAIEKAKDAGHSLKDSVLASDAFFPFRDGVDLAIAAGVKAIIQPGGSIRDEESIKAADEAGIVMVFTGIRHFRH